MIPEKKEELFKVEEWGAIKKVRFRFVFSFVLLFIITLPFPHQYIPDIGGWLSPIFERIAAWSALSIFGFAPPFTSPLLSDTVGLYIHAANMIVLAVLISVMWSLLDRKRLHYHRVFYWLIVIVSYYLALQLLDYGFNKVFKWQFYLPEPNTLFTTVGETPRDVLYWSSMGSSRLYTMFAGIVEVLTALLLLFRRTRTFGGLIAFGVMVNVVAVNFGFDISVKIYSLFLLLLSLVVLLPDIGRLFRFFFQDMSSVSEPPIKWEPTFISQKGEWTYSILKSFMIALMLFDVLSIYFATSNFNDDKAPRPPLHGAYEVIEFVRNREIIPPLTTIGNRWQRLFVHRRGYLIVQEMNERMKDYALQVDTKLNKLFLDDPRSHVKSTLGYEESTQNNLIVRGRVAGDSIEVTMRKIDLDVLPLLQDDFHWSIDP